MKNVRLRYFWIFFTVIVILSIGVFIVVYNNSSIACDKYAKQMYAIDFDIQEDEDINTYILDNFMSTYTEALQRCNEKTDISYRSLYKMVYDTRSEMIKRSNGLRKVP
ncbi:MAG: hypothetical protein PHX86_07250, partial [Caldisericia bacterium]|nr:hypothetical protein [Caldisericia bacterium]